jgi:transcriptional activator of cad operon
VLRIGDWRVDPVSGEISRGGQTARLETRALRLLLCLARRAREVVSIDELLNDAWAGVAVSQDSVYQAVATLRRELGDDSKEPRYIETVPRLGYRMVAQVGPWEEPPVVSAETSRAGNGVALAAGMVEAPGTQRRRGSRYAWAAAAAICLAISVAAWALLSHGSASASHGTIPAEAAAPPQRSIAVLPFLDLTEGMHNEEFADGMTEELIDKLSKIPELHVPAPTASFYFKGKQEPPAEIAKSLGVTYLLDGSVRKSGKMVRVAARLIRAANGYVIWTENYDRPFDDILMVQDDIAGEVAKVLKATIANGRGQF